MTNPIRILLADDHNLVRAGIKALLETVADFRIVADVADGAMAFQCTAELLPDVAILDIAMPGQTGLQTLGKIHQAHPGVRIIMLSMHDTEEHVITAMRLGAVGYVLKNAAPQELELAVRAVMNGSNWLSASISRQVVDSYLARVRSSDHRDGLTARQMDVLKLVADGQRTKEIAYTLGVSIKTVETYRTQIMNRLGIQDVAGLVRYAIRQGISEL